MKALTLWKDTWHLQMLVLLIILAGTGFVFTRGKMIPASYGERGPYRAAALVELQARPSAIPADSTCLECHTNVGHERAESRHKSVRCYHCHGLGLEHIALARQAKVNPNVKLAPATDWDGNFRTALDLYVTKDRETCLSCHAAVVGMPNSFRKIHLAQHLEDMGAENPTSRSVCFECHGGHDTAPK